eukprot:TRINITY_DN39395_c0_g1_i1.p3 TRINITY_DN39395_c0_g1~~TRINITY_DN39395_c0_g1_i1.p3  ORF type:complete len:126 (+),score=12.54 TRINITY_DN39395_c0_g1_i1:139-516(+)
MELHHAAQMSRYYSLWVVQSAQNLVAALQLVQALPKVQPRQHVVFVAMEGVKKVSAAQLVQGVAPNAALAPAEKTARRTSHASLMAKEEGIVYQLPACYPAMRMNQRAQPVLYVPTHLAFASSAT